MRRYRIALQAFAEEPRRLGGRHPLEDQLSNDFTYSLRILTLGKEKIERDGVPILPGEWRATAARELFFYLLFMGAKRRREISLDFWPDTNPQKVRSNFHTTLYRVRQALGDNIIVFKDKQYIDPSRSGYLV